MIEYLYYSAFLVSMIFLVMLVIIGQRQNITNFILLFVAIMVGSLGYYSICTATSLDGAVIGNNLVYIGGVFIPILLLLSIANLCQKRIGKGLLTALITFAAIILYFVFQIRTSTIFYRKITLVSKNGVTFLDKEYGPMHTLYPIFVILCMGLGMWVLIRSLSQKKRVSYKVIVSLFVAQVLSVGVYAGERIFHSDMEWMVFIYLLDEILILALIHKIGMYEVSDSIANSLKEHSTYGYMVFDNKYNYIGCNDRAREYLPEIADIYIDRKISEKDYFLYKNVAEKLLNPQNEEEQSYYIIRNKKELRCSIKPLCYGTRKRQVGYLVELEDDTQRRAYVRLLHDYNSELEKAVQEKTEYIYEMQDKMILGIADMIENRDSSTGGHVKRTSDVIKIFIKTLEKFEKEYGFTKEFLEYVAKAAPMHDLGKIAVDDRILRKPDRFTNEEFEVMKNHSRKGAEIVEQVLKGVENEEFVRIAENVAHYHHEKWNGEGYPENLSGITIPPEARIMALADVFDALISKRCYKEKMDYDSVFKIIEDSLGSHFDPELGKLFLGCKEQLISYYNSLS